MNSVFIDKCLRKKFDSHMYQLSNSFIYSEESDFFSITNSGYAQEVEIKISRSDFKADFKKKKHKDFIQLYSGQKYVVRKGTSNWDVKEPIMINFIGEDGKGVWEEDKYGRKRPKIIESGKYKTSNFTMGKKYADKKREKGCIVTETSCGVSIFKPVLPNKFWFAVPKDLVTVDEIPNYAGLYYILESGEVKIIKKAPFIHKEKHNLNKRLLNKFYYLSVKLQNMVDIYRRKA